MLYLQTGITYSCHGLNIFKSDFHWRMKVYWQHGQKQYQGRTGHQENMTTYAVNISNLNASMRSLEEKLLTSAWCSSKYLHKLSILHAIIWKIYKEVTNEMCNWTAHQEHRAQPFKCKESQWLRPYIHHRSNGANWCIKGNIKSTKWNEDSQTEIKMKGLENHQYGTSLEST